MKILKWCCMFLAYGALSIVPGQSPRESAPQGSDTSDDIESRRQESERKRQAASDLNRLMSTRYPPSNRRKVAPNMIEAIELLYRTTGEKESELLAPDPKYSAEFANFLQKPNTGLLKLVTDKGCAKNLEVVTAKPDCLAYTMPGSGNSYSFRVEDYRIARLADITFSKNSFHSIGVYQQGIFVELGNIPLAEVNSQTKGLEFLVNLKPESDLEKAKESDLKFIKGVYEKDFLYSRSIGVKENATYALRSIAYRGKHIRVVNGITYDEFEFDKRTDVIIAFRVVGREENGDVTLLWKLLTKQDSPKLKFKKQAQDEKGKISQFTSQVK